MGEIASAESPIYFDVLARGIHSVPFQRRMVLLEYITKADDEDIERSKQLLDTLLLAGKQRAVMTAYTPGVITCLRVAAQEVCGLQDVNSRASTYRVRDRTLKAMQTIDPGNPVFRSLDRDDIQGNTSSMHGLGVRCKWTEIEFAIAFSIFRRERLNDASTKNLAVDIYKSAEASYRANIANHIARMSLKINNPGDLEISRKRFNQPYFRWRNPEL